MNIVPKTETFEVPITKDELISILRVPLLTIDRAIRAKEIGYLKIGRFVRFTAQDVNDYINSKKMEVEKNKTNGGEND